MNPFKLSLGRLLMHGVQRHKPIMNLGSRFPAITVLTRREDIIDVFTRHTEFSVAPYDVRLRSSIGPMTLGMAEGPEYRRALGFLRASMRPDDVDRVREIVSERSHALIERAVAHSTSLDVISDLCNPLALTYMERYFGLRDPGHGVLLDTLRQFSNYIFNVYLLIPPRVEIPAIRASQKLLAHIEGDIRARKEGRLPNPDDVMGRMISIQDNPEVRYRDVDMARLLLGHVSGSIYAPFWLAMNALRKLMSLPRELFEGARQAARHDDDDAVRDYVLEAARFGPVPQIIWRYCERDAVIAAGTEREQVLPEGTLVALSITAANADPYAVEQPERFRLGRPASERLLFGHDVHSCFAARIGEVSITQMLKALLAQPVLAHVPTNDDMRERFVVQVRSKEFRSDSQPTAAPEEKGGLSWAS